MILTRLQRHLIGIATAVVTFVVYLFTLCPSVDFIDAGELSAITHLFGIAHPTGYPTFTILGGIWAMLPIGNSIYRMNVLSALECAAAVGVFFHLIWFLLGIAERKKLPAAKKTKQRNGQQLRHASIPGDPARAVLAVFGALMIGFSETYWSTALSIEVYSLHMLFVSIVLWLFVTSQFDTQLDERGRMRRWLFFALMLGLSFTNHMTTILLMPAIAVTYFWKNRFNAASWMRIAKATPVFALGLLPYLYLPLRAAANPVFNWGNPQTLERFFWHISGKQYRVWLFAGGDAAKKQLEYFFSTFPGEFAWFGSALALVGLVYVFFHGRKLGVMLALLFFGCVLYSINYDIHDIDSYFLLAYIMMGVWCAFGLLALIRQLRRDEFRVALASAAVLTGITVGMQWSAVSNSGNFLVEDYTRNMFNSLKPNALIVSYQWDFWVSASYHYQYVDGLRPDVVVIDKELMRRSWYLDQLKRNHPDIYTRSEAKIRPFLAEVYKFEHGLPYTPEVIEKKYVDVVNSFFENSYGDRPVYLTVEMEKEFAPGFVRVPEGMAFRLYRPEDVPSPAVKVWDDFAFRPFSRKGRLIDRVTEMYAAMLSNRGIVLFNAQMYREAAEYFRRAIRFNPDDTRLFEWQQRVEAALKMS
jgi:hypothetical protein